MPTKKNVIHIGHTTIDVTKNAVGNADDINFNIYDGTSPNTVMTLNGANSAISSIAQGTVSVFDLNVSGALTTSASTTAPTVKIGQELQFTNKTTTSSTVIGSIYASTGSTTDDHILYIDPYKEDSTGDGVPNKGTVHILGSLIVVIQSD